MSTPSLPSIRFSRELSNDTARLHSLAAGLLSRPGVRAVVIDRSQLEATLLPQRGAAALLDDVAVHGDALAAEQGALPTGDALAADEIIQWEDTLGETLYCVRAQQLATGWRRAALVLLTAVALLLAVLGVLIPGLPTTPFVLLASYGLMRTSRRWHRWLLDSRLFGGVLRDWHLHRGIGAHVRVKALALLVIVVCATCFWPTTPLAVKAVVLIGGMLGGAYVWRLPTAVMPRRAERS
ncbi:YbaN family protein [Lacipirellula sp.]|uniref:YbaN family protein n=1 Tax=Lacipirellula sp. TaxID=2691419 RepID=UPI003D0A7E9E